ncbi:MAG: phosphoribosyltransferase [Deltaproteobacteria bacterium]|nr:phosphoribosyltransferase [Deltaproteobacteria bacterium]
MSQKTPHGIYDLEQYREHTRVFRDRGHAGDVLAHMLNSYKQDVQMVLGIPAGGVPVGVVVAETLNAPFDVAVVSKITLPWNPEAGYGAVAFDGTVRLNKALMARIGLSEAEIQKGIEETTAKVNRRVAKLRKKRPFPVLSEHYTILVDDGLASGFTMLVAVEALKKAGADNIIVAVPTAHKESLDAIISKVDAVFCPNIRSGLRYAVAVAYERWSDVDESEVLNNLEKVWGTPT